jgi:zinc-ribbon domain
VCSNCGKEIEEGQNFCPYCAAPVGGDAPEGRAGAAADTGATGGWTSTEPTGLQPTPRGERSPFLTESDLEPPRAVPLSSFGERTEGDARAQRKLFVVVGAASVALIALIAGLLATDRGRAWLSGLGGRTQAETLAGALRPGSPEFEQYRNGIHVDFEADDDAFQSPRPIGDVVIEMRPTIRNLTGRTINGLELRAAGYDLDGQVVKERTFVVIPRRQSELEANKTMTPSLLIEGVSPNNVPASLKIEVTGVTFK